MRSLALLLALIGLSAAANIYGMNGQQLQEAMMKDTLASDPSAVGATMGFGTLMGQHNDEQGPVPETLADEEVADEREARGAEDKVPIDSNGHHPFGAIMGMMFPEMMFGGAAQDAPPSPVAANGYHGNNGHAQSDNNGHSAPANGNGKPANGHGYSHPVAANGNGHSPAANENGNGVPYSANGNTPATNGNGHSAPANGNGHSKSENRNGRPTNGNKGGGAAAASATSFSRGSNSYSASQAQAFSFGSGNH